MKDKRMYSGMSIFTDEDKKEITIAFPNPKIIKEFGTFKIFLDKEGIPRLEINGWGVK